MTQADAWIIPALPLAAFLLAVIFGRRLPGKGASLSIPAMGLSFVASVLLLARQIGAPAEGLSFAWIQTGNVAVSFGWTVDNLAAIMLVVVSAVSLLVQIYSVGYMHGEKRFNWYFGAMSLFTASMLGLVLANNFVEVFVFWELVGLCSYLLIGFWWEKPEARSAAKKAFLTTKIGDVGFLIGIMLLYTKVGSLDMSAVFASKLPAATAATISILIFMGAMGKSAQFPLHVWLPYAMEGPTPVSALIHAATMVAAGVYLVARAYPLFAMGPASLTVVAWIGIVTALMAATIAITATDVKRILAYSTISQLGLMMTALGVGALTAAVFHLVTHAFFKSLLFLGAGSMIHGAHTNDIYEMGGLVRKMRVTTVTFLIGALALAGIPPLAGFFSKDEILAGVAASGNWVILGAGLLVTFMTAFYIFRLCFIAFWGGRQAEAHESPLVMTGPLIALSVPAASAGLLALAGRYSFSEMVNYGEAAHEGFNYAVMGTATGLGLAGLAVAWAIYFKGLSSDAGVAGVLGPAYKLFAKKYYVDDLYSYLAHRVVLGVCSAAYWVDLHMVDGVPNWTGRLTVGLGDRLRRTQTGDVQVAALYIFVAAVLIAFIVMGTTGSFTPLMSLFGGK